MYSDAVAIQRKQLIQVSGQGVTPRIVTVTCTYVWAGLTCTLPNGSQRPAAVGDTMSKQPDGTWQTREAGTVGPYELAIDDGDSVVYNPLGFAGPAFRIPVATGPNS
jgi:hypothetical protein